MIFLLLNHSNSTKIRHLIVDGRKKNPSGSCFFKKKWKYKIAHIKDLASWTLFCSFLSPLNEMTKITLSDVPAAQPSQPDWQRVRMKPGVQVSM